MNRNSVILVWGAAAILGIFLSGCLKEPTETATKGRVHVVVDESVAPLFSREKEKFEELYPNAKLSLDTARSREAIVQFFNIDSTKVIAVSRALNDEEVTVAKRTNLTYHEFKVAINAIAVIVNPKNPVEQMRTTQLDSVLRGLATNWGLFGGPRTPVAVCLPDQNAGAFEIVATKVLHGQRYASPTNIAKSSPDMLHYVGLHANALGFVSVNWLGGTGDSVKVLNLCDPDVPDSLGVKGEYFSPHQAYVYQNFYTLTSYVYMYSKADIYSPGAGFITFVTSGPGQKIVQNNGLVPATMPIRLVQLNRKES